MESVELRRPGAGSCQERRGRVAWRVSSAQPGQSLVEYSILAALIAVVAMAAVQALGGGIAQVFENILSSIQGLG